MLSNQSHDVTRCSFFLNFLSIISPPFPCACPAFIRGKQQGICRPSGGAREGSRLIENSCKAGRRATGRGVAWRRGVASWRRGVTGRGARAGAGKRGGSHTRISLHICDRYHQHRHLHNHHHQHHHHHHHHHTHCYRHHPSIDTHARQRGIMAEPETTYLAPNPAVYPSSASAGTLSPSISPSTLEVSVGTTSWVKDDGFSYQLLETHCIGLLVGSSSPHPPILGDHVPADTKRTVCMGSNSARAGPDSFSTHRSSPGQSS